MTSPPLRQVYRLEEEVQSTWRLVKEVQNIRRDLSYR
jgi:hypothetical protein